jgi:hypothetical protein
VSSGALSIQRENLSRLLPILLQHLTLFAESPAEYLIADLGRIIMLQRTCSDCGEPIPSARLEAQPDAQLCIDCKAESENRPKLKSHENPEKVKPRRTRKRKTQNVTIADLRDMIALMEKGSSSEPREP